MKISNRQKRALEKITGRPWDSWPPEVVESYFAFTDRGVSTELFLRVWRTQMPGNEFSEVEQTLWDLMQYHVFHPVSVESWKADFRSGLLSLFDFEGCPREYIRHAFEIYEKATGWLVPSCCLRLLE